MSFGRLGMLINSLTLGLGLSLVFSLPALSQDFPNKAITIYCGFEAGATTDLTSRGLAIEAEKLLKVPVVVENKTGGGSSVAASLLASKKADGYTLGVISSMALNAVHVMTRNLPYDPLKDFTFIFTYSTYPGGVCVQNASPFKKFPELIDHARKNPGTLTYSTPGTGTSQHLATEYWAKQANVKLKHIPFKGGAPACTALIGGHVDFTAGAGSHIPYVKQGIFRMLTLTVLEERDPAFPDVPTLKEFGYKLPPAGALVILAPKGLPDPVYNKLESAFHQAANSPNFKKILDNTNMPSYYRNRRQLETEIPKDYKFYAEFLQELGLVKK
jgi:tripartite-type tricarboxylate transporter receptor subunit TctC